MKIVFLFNLPLQILYVTEVLGGEDPVSCTVVLPAVCHLSDRGLRSWSSLCCEVQDCIQGGPSHSQGSHQHSMAENRNCTWSQVQGLEVPTKSQKGRHVDQAWGHDKRGRNQAYPQLSMKQVAMMTRWLTALWTATCQSQASVRMNVHYRAGQLTQEPMTCWPTMHGNTQLRLPQVSMRMTVLTCRPHCTKEVVSFVIWKFW